MTATAAARPRAVFTEGSTLRHVLVMTATASVGLIAIFIVDFFSLLYVSWLGDTVLTAAVGYSSQINFFAMSLNIGMMIPISALVSRALGAGDRAKARRMAASGLVISASAALVVSLLFLPFRDGALGLLGAQDRARDVASAFLLITLPSNVLMALGMGFGGVLRAAGDARRGMNVTLAGGLITAVTDPLLIFGLGFGVYGAAIATVISRMVFACVGYYGAVKVHDLVAQPSLAGLKQDTPPFAGIALPSILTNMATPFGGAFALRTFSQFGESAVAANAIIDRVIPIGFAVIFALTGAVGPIFGQNLGAKLFPRVRQALADSLLVTGAYALCIWALLFLLSGAIVAAFKASPETAGYVRFFCAWGVLAWVFLGLLYVANAAFNNLGFPLMSTAFNWGRATLGTIPFVIFGAAQGGVAGGMLGLAAGAALFSVAAVFTAFYCVRRLAKRAQSA